MVTVSGLIRLLKASDYNVQFPALKAVANMLTSETNLIIDKALFERVLDRLLDMA